MLALVIVLPLLAAFLLGWYFFGRAQMRRRVIAILSDVDLALAGEGHASGIEQLSGSRYLVPLQLSGLPFRRASVVLELAPQHNPVAWTFFALRRRSEQLHFQADLHVPLGCDFEGANERWSGRTRRGLNLQRGEWEFESWAPCVITTHPEWSADLTSVVNALLASRALDVSQVRFQRSSPNFSATIPLASLASAALQRPSLLDMLRTLATEVSASHL